MVRLGAYSREGGKVEGLKELGQVERSQYDRPRLAKFRQHMQGSRFERIRAIYYLVADLVGLSEEQQEQRLIDYATEGGGGSLDGLRQDLRWAQLIDINDLMQGFAEEGLDWTTHITNSHLRLIARPRDMGSKDRVEWLVKAHQGKWYASTLKEELIDAGHLPKPKSMGRVRASDLLCKAASAVRKVKQDIDLSEDMAKQGDKPIRLSRLLRKLADRWDEMNPNLSFVVNDEKTKDTPSVRQATE